MTQYLPWELHQHSLRMTGDLDTGWLEARNKPQDKQTGIRIPFTSAKAILTHLQPTNYALAARCVQNCMITNLLNNRKCPILHLLMADCPTTRIFTSRFTTTPNERKKEPRGDGRASQEARSSNWCPHGLNRMRICLSKPRCFISSNLLFMNRLNDSDTYEGSLNHYTIRSRRSLSISSSEDYI